jgi:hypothetical protein
VPARNQKLVFALWLVLLGGITLLVVLLSLPAPPAVIILPPTPLVVKSGRVPDRWIPAGWTWLHRACQFVFGPLKQVDMRTQIIQVSETANSIIALNSLGQPQAESNGLAVWILPDGASTKPKGDTKILAMPRMTTSDGMAGSLGVGTTTGGFSVELFPQLHGKSVDLSVRLTSKLEGQTNFLAAMRAHLPYGQTLVVLDVRQPALKTNRYEFLIVVDEIDAKGNKVHQKAGRK